MQGQFFRLNRLQDILQGGGFSVRMELSGGELTEAARVFLTLDEIITEEFSVSGGYFMEAEPDLPVLFEKRTKIKFKKHVFATESNELHETSKRAEINPYMKGCPLLNSFVSTLEFECLSLFLRTATEAQGSFY